MRDKQHAIAAQPRARHRSAARWWAPAMLAVAAAIAGLAACGGSGDDTPATPPVAKAPTPGVAASATGYAGGVVAVSHPLAA
jgi:hypothetical protein